MTTVENKKGEDEDRTAVYDTCFDNFAAAHAANQATLNSMA